jgi:hypothetical protein
MPNPWLVHVKKVSTNNKGKGLKEILKMAKKTYKKSPGVHKKARKKKRKKTHKKRKTKHRRTKHRRTKHRKKHGKKHRKKHRKTRRTRKRR